MSCNYRINWEEKHAKSNGTSTPLPTTENTSNSNSIMEKREFYLIIYSGIVALGIITSLSRSFSFYRMCLRISINLHDMIFRGVTRATMLFFNNNPSGRIINRFARDIGNVDSILPKALYEVSDVSEDRTPNNAIFTYIQCTLLLLHLTIFCLGLLAICCYFGDKCNRQPLVTDSIRCDDGFLCTDAFHIHTNWSWI